MWWLWWLGGREKRGKKEKKKTLIFLFLPFPPDGWNRLMDPKEGKGERARDIK